LFLGHSSIATTSRYLKSTPTRLARALEKLEAGFAYSSHTDTSSTASVVLPSTAHVVHEHGTEIDATGTHIRDQLLECVSAIKS
jgi:hypothetical protein